MEQVLSVWNALSVGRRLVVGLATMAVFAAVLSLARMASQPSMALLYAGLEPQAAAAVVAALEGQGAAYEVRGGALFVEAAQRDALRMALAGEGLPATGAGGYEILDSLTGFGTTAQMFDAAYWRAKEGELARTITASPHVRTARVHIANPASRPFQRDQAATSSVTVTAASGSLAAGHAKALKFLVASAVAGLGPENVTVIDSNGGIVAADEPGEAASLNSADRAEALKRRVERLLEARVGYGNAVVEVSLDTEMETEQIVERRVDPDSRVAISTEKTETSTRSDDTRGGAVTVASNLPDGDGEGASGTASSSNSETRGNGPTSKSPRPAGSDSRARGDQADDGGGADRRRAHRGGRRFLPLGRHATRPSSMPSVPLSRRPWGSMRSGGDEITIQFAASSKPIVPAGSPPPTGLLGQLSLDVMSLNPARRSRTRLPRSRPVRNPADSRIGRRPGPAPRQVPASAGAGGTRSAAPASPRTIPPRCRRSTARSRAAALSRTCRNFRGPARPRASRVPAWSIG